MSQPLVSVIVAVKNGARFLAQALDSILAQDYRPLEIIIVDGQSTDDTARIAHSYPEARFLPQATLGVANAYNQGIAAALGEFVAFLSHDDLWLLEKLSSQVDYMQAHPEIDYTVTRAEFFVEPGFAFPSHLLREELLEGSRVMRIMETLVARRELFDQIGGLDPQFATGEDVDWYARAQDAAVPLAVLDEVLLRKRIHDANTSLTTPGNMGYLLKALQLSVARKRRQREAA